MRTATAIWRIRPELIRALDDALGVPVDSYVNGSQTWFTGEPTLEWRLHPCAGYRAPEGVSPHDLWELVVDQLAGGTDPAALRFGAEIRGLGAVWDGLECFPAFGDELEPATLVQRVAAVLPLPPDASGLVDHDEIGDEWESTGGTVSILARLERQLAG